jgi:Cu(I)/Ag(I) efflux system membrane protein CusA/SilA
VIERVLASSARHRRAVLAAALLVVAGGVVASLRLSRDAIPDLSDPQIVLVAEWMDHPAPEVASAVTSVLQSALADVPGAAAVRGSSMAGMAYVDVVFESSSRLAAGRQAIVDRVDRARPALPRDVRVNVGPLASSTGWVFQYALVDRSHGQNPAALLRLQQDVLRPALASIPGVAEVASVGGGVEEMLVQVNVEALAARRLAFTDVVAALRSALDAPPSAGAGGSASREAIPLVAPPGSPAARVGDVARVRLAYDMPTGTADFGGGLPAVGGIVIAERNARLPALIGAVTRILEQEETRLPPGVKLIVIYDRLELATRAEHTLLRALGEEIAVVALVILLFLLHARSVLVPVCTLPVVLALTFIGMWLFDIPATIMSLGGVGIALGMAVDADVVALEACHRRLEAAALSPLLPLGARRAAIGRAAAAFAPAVVTSLIIAALTFLPVLAFSGETGRLLGPLAVTKALVFASAAVVALTVGPALRDSLLAGGTRRELDNPLTRGLLRLYRPFVHFALTRPVSTLVIAALALLSCLPLLPRLGAEFLPRIDEGDLLFMPTTLPGAPPDFVAKHVRQQDRAIAGFPEVAAVLGKAGRADTATDPAPYSMAEVTVRLLPPAQWPLVHQARWYSGWAPPALRRALALAWPEDVPPTTADLVRRLDAATLLPGWTNGWTAPARGRMDMMSTGIRTPVGVRVVAPDAGRLEELGAALRDMAASVPGTKSAVLESEGGQPWLEFVPDAGAMARAEVDPALVKSTADTLLAGGQVGEIDRGGRRLRVRVDADIGLRGRPDRIRDVTVRSSSGLSSQPVPLAMLGRMRYGSQAAVVRSERGERTAYVYIDLEAGTDLARYVGALERELARARRDGRVELRPGERVEWAGQYDLLQAGQRRLKWIALLAGLSMLGLLYLQFRSLAEALLVLASVPFALVGSIWALFLAGYSLSAPVWAGLLSVAGLAMQTGVVMVLYIDDAYKRRLTAGLIRTRDDIVAAHMEGTVQRLRPKIMTITTMAAGLMPLLWAAGAGAEIMRRVAVPMIGGLATSAFLTLEVLPVLYTIWRTRQLERRR